MNVHFRTRQLSPCRLTAMELASWEVRTQLSKRVGVGIRIAAHPLRRSGRALLTHPAPVLGDDD